MSDPTAALKRELRQELRERLGVLDVDDRREKDLAIADSVVSLPEIENAESLFCCLSFGVEVDTWGLVRRLVDSGRRLYVPRADFATRSLHVHPYPSELESLSFGLRQPPATASEVAPERIDEILDAAIIPGLAFDRRGFRLGHGGGFFDRFLEGRSLPTIGIAYELQIVDRLPDQPHDLPLSVVTTEREVIRALS